MDNNFSRSSGSNQNFIYLVMGIGVIFLCGCLVCMAVGGYFLYDRLSNDYEDKIVGVWENEDGGRAEFFSDGTFVDETEDVSGRYRFEDDMLIMLYGSVRHELQIEEFTDDRLVLSFEGDYERDTVTLTKIR